MYISNIYKMNGTYGFYKQTNADTGIKQTRLFVTDEDGKEYVESSTVREMAFFSKADHPGIIACTNIVIKNNKVKFTLEHGAQTLESWIKTAGYKKRLKNFYRIFTDIFKTLQYMHDTLLVAHGDMKPANIVLTGNGQPKLIDFGSIQIKHKGTYNKTLTTYTYVSPEEVVSQQYGPTGDVWAVGMIMIYYFTRTYEPMFKNYEELKPWFEKLDIDKFIPKKIPKKLKHIIATVLTVDHTKRPTAAQAIKLFDTDFVITKTVDADGRTAFLRSSNSESEETLVQHYCKIARTRLGKRYNDNVDILCVEIEKMIVDPTHDDFYIDKRLKRLFKILIRYLQHNLF